jgi:hypothetical protein
MDGSINRGGASPTSSLTRLGGALLPRSISANGRPPRATTPPRSTTTGAPLGAQEAENLRN